MPRNLLLASLAPQDLAVLAPRLERVRLRRGRILSPANVPFESVSFVEDGIVSVFALAGAQASAQAWMIGHEGVVGVAAILGQDTSPHRRVVEVDGEALTLRRADLRQAMETMPGLRQVLLRSVHSLLLQTSQIAACNAHHGISQRAARWLLMAHDRLTGDTISVTHASMARALGARRPSVSQALETLSRGGAIAQQRARIEIVDRPALEKAACSCYRLLGDSLARRGGRIGAGVPLGPAAAAPALRSPSLAKPAGGAAGPLDGASRFKAEQS